MSKITPPPLYDALTDETGDIKIVWSLFFNSLFVGDTGTKWIPTFTNLTTSGTPTITGTYYKLSQTLVYFEIIITPATNTSATTASTYCNNFPLVFGGNGVCHTVFDNVGGSGMCNASNNRIYPIGWSAVTTPVTITGTVRAS